MNKISLGIILVFYFAAFAFTQTSNVSKGATVVPKFALKSSDFKTKYGVLKGEVVVEKDANGILLVNGSRDWEAFPEFPAFGADRDTIYAASQSKRYPTPSLVSYEINAVESSNDFTEVRFSKSKDRFVDLKVIFRKSIDNFNDAFNKIFFVGGVEEFKKSDYYQKLFSAILENAMSKLPKELNDLPRPAKVSLLEDVNYQSTGIWTETFKEKKYIVCSYADGVEYNTNRVNQAERIARTIQKYFPVIKRKGKLLLTVKEIEGIELKVKIGYRNFVNETKASYEILQFYVPMDTLKLFIEADITDQELVDKSIVLLNDSRVRVNLSQFSN